MAELPDNLDMRLAIGAAFQQYLEWLERNLARTHAMPESEKIDLFFDEALGLKD